MDFKGYIIIIIKYKPLLEKHPFYPLSDCSFPHVYNEQETCNFLQEHKHPPKTNCCIALKIKLKSLRVSCIGYN